MAKEDIHEMKSAAKGDPAVQFDPSNQAVGQAKQQAKIEVRTSLGERTTVSSRDPSSSTTSSEMSKSKDPPPVETNSLSSTAEDVTSIAMTFDKQRPWMMRKQTLEDNDCVQPQTSYSGSGIATYKNQQMSEDPFHGTFEHRSRPGHTPQSSIDGYDNDAE